MRSKINTLADYREAPFERNVTIPYSEEHVQAQLHHLTWSFKKSVSVEKLEKGDVAVLALESSLEKFNKPSVFLTVGGGLFDRAFEAQLPGRGVGETFQADVNGTAVQVTVKQASRTVFPEPTDEMAAAYAAEHEEFSGVTTVEEYRAKVVEAYYQEKKQDAFFDAMDSVMDYVLTHSDFDFDEDEVAESVAQMKAEFREQLGLEEGAEIPLEKLEGTGIGSLEELEKVMRQQAEWAIATDLWVASVHGVSCADDIKGYPYGFLDEYVRANLTMKTEEK